MYASTPHLDTLLALETQHDDLLQQLDELDTRVKRVLSEYLPKRAPQAPETPSDI